MNDDRSRIWMLVSIGICLALIVLLVIDRNKANAHMEPKREVVKAPVYPVHVNTSYYVITCKSAVTGDVTDIWYSRNEWIPSEYDDSVDYIDAKTNTRDSFSTANRLCNIKPPRNLRVEK